MGEKRVFLRVCRQKAVSPAANNAVAQGEQLSWWQQSNFPFSLQPRLFLVLNCSGAANVCLSRAACSVSSDFQRGICSHSRARELSLVGTRGQVSTTAEEGKEPGQPPDEMTCHWGHDESQWIVSFLQTTVYFSKVWPTPVAAAGRVLACDQTHDTQFSGWFGGASQILSSSSLPASSLVVWKGFSKLTSFFIFAGK